MKETELAEKFIEYFSDNYEIYKEVPACGIIDFVAKSDNTTIAVEVKLSLNFDVIEQANRNKGYCDYSYIAVPCPKSTHFGYQICKMLGIGVIVFDEWGNIHEKVNPIKNRHNRYFKLKLEPYMMRSVAGSKNDRMTEFKVTIENIVQYIKRHPDCTLKECLENTKYHWSNFSGAKSCIYQWIKNGVITEFRLENGILKLNDFNKIEKNDVFSS